MGSRSIAAVVGAALFASQAHAQAPQQPTTEPTPDAAPAPAEEPSTEPAPVTEEVGITEQPVTPPPPAPPAEPQVIVREGSLSKGNALMLVGSGAGLAAGLCLFLAAASDDSDAEAAARYEDHSRIAARADRLRIGAAVSAGVGVALGALAVYRIKFSKKEGTELSLSPKKGGAALVLETSW